MQWFARSRSVLALHVHFRISRTRVRTEGVPAQALRPGRIPSSTRHARELARFIGKLKKSEFEELLEFGETTCKIVAQAREALERHTAEHGC